VNAEAAGRYLRFVWVTATDRDKASLLVCLLFSGFTLVSLAYSSGVDVITKLCWLFAFSVIAWSQVGAIVQRGIQEAITQEFIRGCWGESASAIVEFAGMEHVFLSGRGWAKVVRE
jgi:hypothetical protein